MAGPIVDGIFVGVDTHAEGHVAVAAWRSTTVHSRIFVELVGAR